MAEVKVGKVNHYYDKIQVAVIEVTTDFSAGDLIKISGSNDFTQKAESIQIEHQQLPVAKKGQEVGLRVEQPVKKGDEVYKLS